MRQSLLFAFLCLLLFSCQEKSPYQSEKSDKLPTDYMFMQRAYPTGKVDPDALKEAIQVKNEMLSNTKKPNTVLWEFAGPENVGGRITDIEIPVGQSSIYYAGTASGGIFKTIDGGGSWDPIFDEMGFLSIGDMEISKQYKEVIWVGTGEPNAGGGSITYDGNGVYLSEDGGLNWVHRGLSETGSISKMLIDPNDESTIFAGAMGPMFKNDENRGVYRTKDQGETWEKVLFVSDSTGIIDMVNHPTNSEILYAVAWERIRRPQYSRYGGVTSAVYRSIDGGDTWEELTNGLPNKANKNGRISIAIAQSNPDVLYTRYLDQYGGISGVFRTDDGGDSWKEVNSSDLYDVGFHWWFRGIYVDPTDEDVLYNVDFIVEKSEDGGQSWKTAFPNVHVDQHALAFCTENNDVLLGNDGGVYKSSNNGVTSNKFLNLPITQFYRIHVDAQNVNKVYAGAQDNGTVRTTTGGLNNWKFINGGDGFQPLVDPTNTKVIYALSQRGYLVKSSSDANNFGYIASGIPNSDRNNWDTPIILDPKKPNTIFMGTQRVWRSKQGGQNWQPISPDLTNGPVQTNLSFATITSIDVSTINSDIIIAGTDDGNVWITMDGGNNWTKVSENLPNYWTTKVLADRVDENTFYVTSSGYRYGQDEGHVYKTIDGGESWSDIGSNLPDIPVNDIVKDVHGNLYVGTDIGVFASHNEGASWIPFGENMPAVVVTDMHIHEDSGYLFVATFGRSAYKTDISKDVVAIKDVQGFDVKIFPNPTVGNVKIQLPDDVNTQRIELLDVQGKNLQSIHTDNRKEIMLDLSNRASGVYFVRLISNTDEVLQVEKIIKQN